MKFPRSLNKVLHGSSLTLSGVVARASKLEALNASLRPLLGPALAPHCRVANLRHDTLVMQVDSPAWAARLRYQAPAVLKAMRNASPSQATLSTVEEIQVKIRPPSQRRATKPARRPRMSSAVAQLIDAAAQCTDDASLQAALRRLASRSNDRQE